MAKLDTLTFFVFIRVDKLWVFSYISFFTFFTSNFDVIDIIASNTPYLFACLNTYNAEFGGSM